MWQTVALGVVCVAVTECYVRSMSGWEERWSRDLVADNQLMGLDRSTGAIVGYEKSTGRVFSRAPRATHPPHMDIPTAYIISALDGACNVLHGGVEPQWAPLARNTNALEGRALWHVSSPTGWVTRMQRVRIRQAGRDCECAFLPVRGRYRSSPMHKVGRCKAANSGAHGCGVVGRALSSQQGVIVAAAHRWSSSVSALGCQSALAHMLAELQSREAVRGNTPSIDKHPRPSKGMILSNIKSAFSTLDRIGPVASVLHGTMTEMAHASCARGTDALEPRPTEPCSGKHHAELAEVLETPSVALTPNHLNVTHIVAAALDYLCNATECTLNRTRRTTGFAHCVALSLGGPEIEAAIAARRTQLTRGTDASAIASIFGGSLAGNTVCEAAEKLRHPGKDVDTQADDAGVVVAASVRGVVNSITTALATAEVAMGEWSRVADLQRHRGSKLYNVTEDVCCCSKRHFARLPDKALCESTQMRLFARYAARDD